jgi:hypothetical protein
MRAPGDRDLPVSLSEFTKTIPAYRHALANNLRLNYAPGDGVRPVPTPAAVEGRRSVMRLAQQGDVMTASASGTTQADACTSAINVARNYCIQRGFFNILKVDCKCGQTSQPGPLAWDCVGTASCQK